MSEHRFREHLMNPSLHAVSQVHVSAAFVACAALGHLSPSHQLQVQEVYRIAAERTREQLRRQRPFPPAFSLN